MFLIFGRIFFLTAQVLPENSKHRIAYFIIIYKEKINYCVMKYVYRDEIITAKLLNSGHPK